MHIEEPKLLMTNMAMEKVLPIVELSQGKFCAINIMAPPKTVATAIGTLIADMR